MYKMYRRWITLILAIIATTIVGCSSESDQIEFPTDIETVRDLSEKYNFDWHIEDIKGQQSNEAKEEFLFQSLKIEEVGTERFPKRIGTITVGQQDNARFVSIMIHGIPVVSDEEYERNPEFVDSHAAVDEAQWGNVFSFISDLYGDSQHAEKIYEEFKVRKEKLNGDSDPMSETEHELMYIRKQDNMYYLICSMMPGEIRSTLEDGTVKKEFYGRDGHLTVNIMSEDFYNGEFKEANEKFRESNGLGEIEIITGDL